MDEGLFEDAFEGVRLDRLDGQHCGELIDVEDIHKLGYHGVELRYPREFEGPFPLTGLEDEVGFDRTRCDPLAEGVEGIVPSLERCDGEQGDEPESSKDGGRQLLGSQVVEASIEAREESGQGNEGHRDTEDQPHQPSPFAAGWRPTEGTDVFIESAEPEKGGDQPDAPVKAGERRARRAVQEGDGESCREDDGLHDPGGDLMHECPRFASVAFTEAHNPIHRGNA